jgi:hypothetical protein
MLSVNPEADIDDVEKTKMSTLAWKRTPIYNP